MDRKSQALSAEPASAELAPAPKPAGHRPELALRLQRIEASRARLGATLVELRDEAEDRLSWRRWVRKRPLAALGLAAGAGLLLGRVLAPGRRHRGEGGSRDGRTRSAISAGLGALAGSSLVSRLAPLVIDRALDFVVRKLEGEARPEPEPEAGVDASGHPEAEQGDRAD